MKNQKWIGALAACVLLLGAPLLGTATASTPGSHYTYGVEGVLGATAPPPGWHYRMYNLWYSPSTYKDNSGNAQGNFDLEVFASVHRIFHMTDVKILGADFFYDIIIPLVDQDFSLNGASDSHSFSLGDITLQPIGLAWRQPRWDAAFALAVVLPTGQFDGREGSSPGLGYWSGMMTLGGTLYLDSNRTWSASVLTRTLINGEQDDTNVTPGSEFVAEYGIGKDIQVNNNWMIRPGLAGASYWQIDDDSEDNLAYGILADTHKQSHAIGAELNVLYLPALFQVNLRYLQDYGVENGPEGSRFIATLSKSF